MKTCQWKNTAEKDEHGRPMCMFDQKYLEPSDCENCPFYQPQKED